MPEAPTGNPATDFSIAFLTDLVHRGIRNVVVSPGSRSQALALVAAELERIGAIRLHVRIDERVAGFLTLGLAVETATPTVVITTSGTATANLHPAILEAHHAGVPMIVVTADRPSELRGIRANQTTRQPGMFGDAVRAAHDVDAPDGSPGDAARAAAVANNAVDAALGTTTADPGPVHVNLAFREPLSAAVPPLDGLAASGDQADTASDQQPTTHAPRTGRHSGADPRTVADRPTLTLAAGPRTVVIAGAGAGAEAEEVARAGGWPLLAEVASGARFGPNLVVAYRDLLALPNFGARIERAVVFGHPTLSREIPALLTRDDVDAIVVAPRGVEVYNPGRRARIAAGVTIADADLSSPEARAWVGSWVFASRRLRDQADESSPASTAPDLDRARSFDRVDQAEFARAELAAVRAPVTRAVLAEALWRYTWPHDRLVFGASRLIREADRTVPGKKIRVHANRGLAGIDGTVATAIGIALASQAAAVHEGGPSGVTRVLLGDLTLLHDVGALLFGEGETRPHLQVIVGNDGGGTIFDALEVAWTAPQAALERVLYTPQRADLAALATAYGWEYSRVTNRGELDQALSAPPAGPSILEVPLDR